MYFKHIFESEYMFLETTGWFWCDIWTTYINEPWIKRLTRLFFYIFRPVLYSLRYCITLSGTYQSYLPQFSSRRRHIPPTLFLHLQTSVVLSEVLHHAIWYLPILIFFSFLQDVITFLQLFLYIFRPVLYSLRYCITLSGTYQSYPPQFSSRRHHIPPTLFYIFRPVLYSLKYCVTLSGTYQSYLPQFSSRRRHIPPTLFLHLQTCVVLSEVLHHAIWYLPILSSSVFFKTSSHSSNSFSTSSDQRCTLWGIASRYLVLTNLIFLSFLQDVVTCL